jgi:RNA polymerase sigma-54 factor
MNQHLKQSQQMRLSPQVIQSIELLTLPIQDLIQEIKNELEENPALEVTEEDASTETDLGEQDAERSRDLEEKRLEYLEEINRQSDADRMTRKKASSDAGDKKLEVLQNTPGKGPTIQEALHEQVSLLDIDPRTREIADMIIYNISPDGYLLYELEEIIAGLPALFSESDPDEAMEEVEYALGIVQSLDPPGVGARNTEECLLLQLNPEDVNFDLLYRLITRFLDDVGKNRLPYVAKEMGLEIDELKLVIEDIRHLNPRPGSAFESASTPYIIPDVKVDLVDERYEVILEDATIPRLTISSYVKELLAKENLSDEEKEYLIKKVESGKRLISSIEHRKSTISKIAQEIVKIQQEFFVKGIKGLRPLKMEEVADAIGVHVSTVSRAVNEKYMQTPKGIYPLKFFFTGATQSSEGEDESRLSVQERIRVICEQEDKAKPLNDSEIAEALQEEGLQIARRTVTKYRKVLGIPSARQRKEF